MAKIFLNEFNKKLNKKRNRVGLNKESIKINFEDFSNKRNQVFTSCLADYLNDETLRKTIVKINPYTIKFGEFSRINKYGTQSVFHVTLSLLNLSDDGSESWECIIYESDDMHEHENKIVAFDNGKDAIKYFAKQAKALTKN